MIARTWFASTTRELAPRYAEHLRTHVLPNLHGIAGFEGLLLLEREVDGTIQVQVMTFWRSLDAIRAFAGADLEHAVVADEAAALLTAFDRRATHYGVALRV